MALQTFIQGYQEVPIVTRVFTTACVWWDFIKFTWCIWTFHNSLLWISSSTFSTTCAVHLDLISPFQLYFNPNLILQGQVWRLLTTFLFFGTVGFSFLFNMIFTCKLSWTLSEIVCLLTQLFVQIALVDRYCRMLEEGSFRGESISHSTADIETKHLIILVGKTSDFIVMFMFGAVFMIFFAFFINLLFLGQAFTIMLVYVWSRRNPFLRMNFFGLLNFQAPYLPWVSVAVAND